MSREPLATLLDPEVRAPPNSLIFNNMLVPAPKDQEASTGEAMWFAQGGGKNMSEQRIRHDEYRPA